MASSASRSSLHHSNSALRLQPCPSPPLLATAFARNFDFVICSADRRANTSYIYFGAQIAYAHPSRPPHTPRNVRGERRNCSLAAKLLTSQLAFRPGLLRIAVVPVWSAGMAADWPSSMRPDAIAGRPYCCRATACPSSDRQHQADRPTPLKFAGRRRAGLQRTKRSRPPPHPDGVVWP